MPKSKNPRKIPYQARRLVREVLSGKHKTLKAAGVAAGYSPDSAHRTLASIAGTMDEIMNAAGLTDAHLVKKCLSPLLHAKSVRFFQADGEILESRPFADHDTRLRALDIALRIKGKYAPLAVEQSNKHTVQVLVLDVPRPKRDVPAPTVIEVAKLPDKVTPANGNGHNGNGHSNGNGHKE